MCKEQQDKRFEQERTILVKNYENDLQSMIDQQKKQVEKAEEQQHVDLKVTSKKIRADQEKELKNFRYELNFCIDNDFFQISSQNVGIIILILFKSCSFFRSTEDF